MIEYWKITAYCVNEKGVRKSFETIAKNVGEFTRCCNCMKITKGYDVVEYRFQKEVKMFEERGIR